ATLFDGFFPFVPFDATPGQGARTGLQEMGLPYVADAAVSKHLAAFIRQHVPPTEGVDAILFNGGVFQPDVLRQRVVDVMRPWFDQPAKKAGGGAGEPGGGSPRNWDPLILTSPSLDLAVAWGAAYFAWLKHSGGRRIGGGIPRSYYVAVEATGSAERGARSAEQAEELDSSLRTLLCVVPRRMQEGDEVRMPEPVLELALGEPVLFPLYTSTVRGDDKPGQLLRLPEEALMRLPPLHTILRGGKRAGAKRVPVTLAAKCTEIGTLELYCESKEGNRWRLEFNVRDVLREPTKEEAEADAQAAVIDVFPEEKVQAAGSLVAAVFGAESPAVAVTTADLPKLLEGALESSRGAWPTGLCRRLWEFLETNAAGRAKSPGHLSRWYNLTGFVLRPGFGDPVDRYRVEGLWKLITAAARTQTPSGPKNAAVPEGG
ncbi:MAG: molecular chaperone DnaK, partial [Gemmataceae bacterium]|nr:molecular chaperone DnaK [Gemmataceae bacterium]